MVNMMFSDNEKSGIEDTKIIIKKLISTRVLLWNGITRNVVIAGGFFTSLLQNKPFKDIDIFVLNNDVSVYNSLTEGFARQEMAGPGTRRISDDLTGMPQWTRSEMMNYNHNPEIVDVINNNATKAQYILTKYKTREELLAHFDYKHCKVSYVPDDDKLYITRETFDCICDKVLKINNEQNSSNNHQYRLTNFMNKGWTLDDKSKEKLADIQREAIKESFNKLKIDAYMKAVNEPGSYTIGEDALKQLGLTAQALQAQILGK
jgi:hypothetical protein